MRIKPVEIIKFLKINDLNVVKTANILGIHRSTVYRWVNRAKSPCGRKVFLKQKSLYRKSTKPKTIHYALISEQKTQILELRNSKGYSAEKIKRILKLNLSVSTIKRFLRKKNLLRKQLKYRRPKYQGTKHMHLKNTNTIGYLQMDVKYITPELSGLPWTCFEYAVIDIFSRYKEAVILNHLDQDGSISSLLEIVPKLPFKPVFIQTDNGLEFQGRFQKMCQDMGLKHHMIHKSTPNENALIERSFRTDEEEFFFLLEKAPQHYDELRLW